MNETGSRLWRSQFRSAAAKLRADFEGTSIVSHATTKGAIREDSFHAFLRRYVPRRFDVGSGIAVDSGGRQSNQIDVAIFDAWDAPTLFTSNGQHLIPIESLYAIIEVKSTLTTDAIDQAIRHFSRVKKLKRVYYDDRNGLQAMPPEVLFAVFAYSGMELASAVRYLSKKYARTHAHSQLHSVYTLGRGVVVCGASQGEGPYESKSTRWEALPEVDSRYPEFDGFAWTILNLIEQLTIMARARPRMSLEPYLPG